MFPLLRVPSYALQHSSSPVSTCSQVEVRWHTTKTTYKSGDVTRSSVAQIALLEDLFAWSLASRCLDSDPYFAIRVGPNLDIFSRDTATKYIKGFAATHSLDPSTVSNHCNRHGGATQRTALGSTKASLHQALNWSRRSNSSDNYITHISTVDPSGVISLEDLRNHQRGAPTAPPSIAATPTSSPLVWGGGRTGIPAPVRSSSGVPPSQPFLWWGKAPLKKL